MAGMDISDGYSDKISTAFEDWEAISQDGAFRSGVTTKGSPVPPKGCMGRLSVVPPFYTADNPTLSAHPLQQ